MSSSESSGDEENACKRAEELGQEDYKPLDEIPHDTQKFTNPQDYYHVKQVLYNADEEFERRLAWAGEQDVFTTIHTENGLDGPGQMDHEIEELWEWFDEWLNETF